MGDRGGRPSRLYIGGEEGKGGRRGRVREERGEKGDNEVERKAKKKLKNRHRKGKHLERIVVKAIFVYLWGGKCTSFSE
ncbi:MAG: hypothetical protein II951_05435 [Bacteroidales bacterium]|nr:hypothetical protein [Bacteroidales bacterium]